MKKKLIILLTIMSVGTLGAYVFSNANDDVEEGMSETLPDGFFDTTPEVEEDLDVDLDVEFDEENPDEVFLSELLYSIEMPASVNEDFELLTEYDGVALEWTSSNEVIEINNGVAIVTQDYIKNVQVAVTVSAKYNDVELSRNFVVVVEVIKMGNPNDYTIFEAYEYLSNVLYRTNYMKTQTGTSSGKASSIFTAEQSVNSYTVRYNNQVYFSLESLTTKSFAGITKNIYHNATYKDGCVDFIHESRSISDSDTTTSMTEEDFASTYGVLANSIDFTSYIFNDSTVLSTSSLSQSGDLYCITFNMDISNTDGYKAVYTQTAKFGDVSSLSFSKITVQIYFDSNWVVDNFYTEETYTGKVSGSSVAMTQKLTNTYEYY